MTRDQKAMWIAVLVGVALRIVPLSIWPEEACVRDECSYVRIAEKIASGEGMTAYGGWLWAPGYPTWLALHKIVTGWCSPAKGTQIVLGAVNALLLYRLGTIVGGPRVARFAIWLYALSPSLIFYTISMWSETIYTTVFLGTFVALHRARSGVAGTVGPSILLGVLSGLLVLFRGVALFMVPLWLVGLLWRRTREPRAWGSAALALALAVATVAPYSWMISTKYDALIVSDRTLGQMMWLGNNDFPPITFDYGGPLSSRRFTALEKIGRPVCAPRSAIIARDDCQTREGFEWIEDHPREFVLRIPDRWAQMLTPHSLLTRHLRWGSWRGIPPLAAEALVVGGAVTSALAVIGGAVGLAIWAEGGIATSLVLIVLYNLAAIGALAGLSRYRAPLEPMFMIYCGLVMLDRKRSWERARAEPWRGILASVVALALVPLVLWYLPSGWPRWRTW